MRTKTLLLTAALTAAGAATLLAQTYSANVVGYINVTNYPGFNLIANQLNASPDNKITNIIPADKVPNESSVYKLNPATGLFDSLTSIDQAWEGNNLDLSVGPGEGMFTKITGLNNVVLTFVGDVKLSSSVPIVEGFSIVSSALPIAGALDAALPSGLGYPGRNGDSVYQYSATLRLYNHINSLVDGAWEGTDSVSPQIAVGEAFFVKNTGGAGHAPWAQSYTVGQ